MTKAVITGAGGMIGLALIKRLTEQGNGVIAVVRPGSQTAERILKSDKVTIIECGLEDYDSFIPSQTADIFYHLAWDKTTVQGRDDAAVQAKNIQYSLCAVRLASRFGCRTFVGAGSQAEYGITNEKLSQKTPVNPQSCYGIAKYSAGKLTQKLCAQLGIRHCWTRILSVYGEHDGAGSLISYLIRTLSEGGTPQLTKCEQIWDYIYCDDAAAALDAIGSCGKDGNTYCIGSGIGRPLREFVNDIKECINKNAKISFGAKDYYPHQPMHLVADIEDLTNDTGFVPKISFKEGIAKTVKRFRG